MGLEVTSINELESRVEGWLPFSQVGGNPMQWHGVPFECGCGEIHYYNNVRTPMLLVKEGKKGGVVILSTECKHLNAIQFKGFFNFSIVSLFSCKLEDKEESFGLQNKELLAEIEDLSSRFSDSWEGW